jgi:hypothetical protein
VDIPVVRDSDQQSGGFEKITYSNNYCEHRWKAPPGGSPEDTASISLWGAHLIVMGNHVKGNPDGRPSIDFNDVERVAVMGNITTGSLINLPNPIPSPPEQFNVITVV